MIKKMFKIGLCTLFSLFLVSCSHHKQPIVHLPQTNLTENELSEISDRMKKIRWEVKWSEDGGHYQKGDKFKFKVVAGKIKKFCVKKKGSNTWTDRDVDLSKPHDFRVFMGFADANFYFFGETDKHSHQAQFRFGVFSRNDGVFSYNISHTQTTVALDPHPLSAHGKGGGVGN